MQRIFRLLLSAAALGILGASQTVAQTAPTSQPAGHYKSFSVCLYCPQGTLNLQNLERNWAAITSQIKIDKVYIETYRSRRTVPEETIEPLKKFFIDKGVRIAGGMTLASNDSGQFQTFSFANAADRETVKGVAEMTARHFDEIILDDFFFYSTKTDEDIAAKGDKSWTQYRLDAMRDASENLVVKPARAINPKVKMVIKYPNWYEHFQGLGYDLEMQPKIFDGIYTGTETRDPLATEQHLQPYQSYQIIRYFDNIKPGGNGGGWVDGYQYTVVDRYAEQLWDTVFAKAPEMMLFNFSQIQQAVQPGNRTAWEGMHTSFDYDQMKASYMPPAADPAAPPGGPGGRSGFGGGGGGRGGPPQPPMSRAAGYALEQADQFVYKLGTPIGLKSYRPYQATGEDFLHNFLGMAGIPIDLYPTFPTDANTILLTESAKYDPDIVAKIKGQLTAGKNVIVTSGLVKALQEKSGLTGGLNDICELEFTGNRVQVTDFHGQGGALIPNSAIEKPIIFPEIKFKTNDAWYVLAGIANGNGFPLLISDKYSKGVLYVLTIPDNFTDLYSIPPSAFNLIRGILTRDLPVRVDGPAQVSLFEYDNNTFIVQNFAATEAAVTIAVTGHNSLRNLLTDEVLSPTAAGGRGRGRGFGGGGGGANNPNFVPPRTNFTVTIKPHSYLAFASE